MNATSLTIGLIGLLVTCWFGFRSMFQSLDREALQSALRAYNQALYNNLWRMGDSAEKVLESANLTDAQRLAQGIADMSQTARHTLVAFSKEHTRFNPFYEPAWEPKPISPESERSLLRRLFCI
jgi:hypothetical protein